MRKSVRYVAIAATVIFVALQAAGCQPNPTVPPVVGKSSLEDKIKDRTPSPSQSAPAGQTAAATASAAPQRVTDTLQEGKMTVNVDATLELPAEAKLPVVKVAPKKFTQAETDNIIKVLFQGKQPYKPREKLSKSEIQKQIVNMKAMKSQATGKNKDKMDAKLDSAIAYYEEQLKTAPDVVNSEPSDGKLKTDEIGGQEIFVNTPLGKDTDASLNIYNSKSGRTCSVWFINENSGQSYLGTESAATGQPRGVKMTLDDAKALAQKTVTDLGSDLKYAGVSIGTSRSMGKAGQDSDAPQAWIFAFTREVNGVPTVYESDIGANVPQEEIDRADAGGKGEYIEPHPYERIMMAIDDSGILEFQWSSPDTVLSSVSEDVQTLTFEEAMQTFNKQFFIHNALKNKSDEPPVKDENGKPIEQMDNTKYLHDAGIFTYDSIGYGENVKSCTFNIDRITLGLTRIAVKDKQDEFMVVPVYDFFGTVTVEYTAESGYTGFTTTDAHKSFLTINAIDGSIINRGYGY